MQQYNFRFCSRHFVRMATEGVPFDSEVDTLALLVSRYRPVLSMSHQIDNKVKSGIILKHISIVSHYVHNPRFKSLSKNCVNTYLVREISIRTNPNCISCILISHYLTGRYIQLNYVAYYTFKTSNYSCLYLLFYFYKFTF